jgi:hypothetical protein
MSLRQDERSSKVDIDRYQTPARVRRLRSRRTWVPAWPQMDVTERMSIEDDLGAMIVWCR